MNMTIDREKTLEVLQQLVRLRTVLPRADEKDLVRYVVSLFPPDTLETHVIDHGDNRASLVAVLPGLDRSRKIAFEGHTDTLPVFRQEDWDYSPFGAHYHEGYIYGRGSANMKGGITAMVMALLHFVTQGQKPPADIVLCLCADGDAETFYGATAVAKGGFLEGVQEIIFAEPTNLRVAIAQRGGIWMDIDVKGRSCYACRSELGVNAVEKVVQFHNLLTENIVHSRKEAHPFFGKPTCTLTALEGGLKGFLIPDEATATIDIRLLPDQDHEEVVRSIGKIADEMMRETPRLSIATRIKASRPSVGMTPDAPMIRRFEETLRAQNRPVCETGLFYLTDASILIPALGVPFLFYGPGEEVYTCLTNERIELDSVVEAAETFVRYIAGSR